jgi:hypothetical protein
MDTGNPIGSLYPQPAKQAPPDWLAQASSLIDIANGIKDYQGKAAVADAIKNNADQTNPAGFNPEAAAADVAKSGTFNAPAGIGAIQGVGGTATAQATTRLNLAQNQAATIAALSNPTMADFHQWETWMAGVPGARPHVETLRRSLGPNPSSDQIKNAMRTFALGAMGHQVLLPSTSTGAVDPQTGAPLVMSPGQAARSAGTLTGMPLAAQDSAKAYAAAQAQVGDYGNRMNQLQEAYERVHRSPESAFGPGGERRQEYMTLAHMIAPGMVQKGYISNEDELADVDVAKKVYSRYATAAAGGGGATSDQMAAAASGNPNMHMSKAGLLDSTRIIMAQEMAQLIRMKEGLKAGPAGYAKTNAELGPMMDQRALLPLMLPQNEQRAAMDKLSRSVANPVERERIKRTFELARKHGLAP